MWRYLRVPTFSHFSRTPTCDGQTDRQTHDHGIYRESRARAVKSRQVVGIAIVGTATVGTVTVGTATVGTATVGTAACTQFKKTTFGFVKALRAWIFGATMRPFVKLL